MVDPAATRRVALGLLFAALSGVLLLVQILPFGIGPEAVPGPCLVTLLAFAWVLRRPDTVPAALIAAILLAADIVLMRPPGLWAALGLAGSEALRRRAGPGPERTALSEWLRVALVLAAMSAAQVVLLGVLFVPQPPLASQGLVLATSVLAYPVAAVVVSVAFGIRRPRAGAAGARP